MSIYHDPEKGEKPFVLGCSVFGGRNPKTGRRVGSRHQWELGNGRGRCNFCGNWKDGVMSHPKPKEMTLAEAIKRGEIEDDEL